MPPVRNPYQQWELDLIRNVYPFEGPQGCIDRGMERPVAAIRTKASEMGITLGKEQRAEIRRRLATQYRAQKAQERTPWDLPDEYLGATDIFQVGYLVAQSTGTLDQFVGQR